MNNFKKDEFLTAADPRLKEVVVTPQEAQFIMKKALIEAKSAVDRGIESTITRVNKN